MTGYLFRVEGELSPELLGAFPQLTAELHLVQTVLSGQVTDASELLGIMEHLSTVGVDIVEVVRLPDPAP
jgi:hypothetical protein